MQIVVEIDITGTIQVKSRNQENTQESETKLLITITAKDYSTGKSFADEQSCSIPLPTEDFRAKNLEWRKEYVKWFEGIETLIESPTVKVDTNPTISVSEECQKIGRESISYFNEWFSYHNVIRAALLEVLPSGVYKQNPHDFRFILRTRTGDSNLDLELQRLPIHAWGFLQKSYPHAEIALNMNNRTLAEVVRHQRPRILVILGYDPKIDFIPHQESISQNIPADLADIQYWSCKPGNPNTGKYYKEDPKSDLFATLKASSPEVVIFIGHSKSTQISSPNESVHEAPVEISLDNKNSISLEDLTVQEILRGLGTNGTIFAAFISCDGQRIAPIVNTLGIPCVMVSLEILPVHIAKILLAKFLEEATKPGVPIHIALSYARQHLRATVEHSKIEGCPNASNFPVIFQIPDRHSYILNPIPEPEPAPKTVPKPVLEAKPVPASTIWQTLIQDLNKLRRTLFGKILIFLLISSLGLILALTWAITHLPPSNVTGVSSYTSTANKIASIPKSIQDSQNISLGEKPLTDYKEVNNPFKDIGFEEFGKGNYTVAKSKFNTYLSKYKNSPEILIAINNSIAAENANNDKIEPLRLAVGVPFISNPIVAREILAGISMYQKKINDKGGRLQIVIGKDDNTGNSAIVIAKEFVKEPSILGVIGHNASAASLPAATHVYSPKKLVMLTPTAFDDGLEKMPYVYRMVSQLVFFAEQIKEEIKTLPNSKTAVCLDQLAPDNVTFNKIFTHVGDASGMKMESLPCADFKNINNTGRIQKIVKVIRDTKSNAILIAPHVDSIRLAIDLAKVIRNEPTLSKIRLFGTPSFYTRAAEDIGVGENGIGIDGLTVPVPYFPGSKDEFSTKYKTQWGDELNNWRTSMAYASTEALYSALLDTPTREGLNNQLTKKEFHSTVIGKFRFDKTSHNLEYSNRNSSKGVLIELHNKKFRLLRKLM